MATPLPPNEAAFSLADLVLVTGATVVREAARDFVGVSTDSRTISARNVFVALTGDRFDGHAHVAGALRQGASAAIVSRMQPDIESAATRASILQVEDTRAALGALARAHRRRWARAGAARRVIAITGSAGKTTTRHAVASVLSTLGRSVHASLGNLNNLIGAPMTLLALEDRHDTLVAEIGTNQRGEIAALASIVEPEVGVLTLVSEAHGEGLGSVWDIAQEKSDLFVALPQSGVAIANADDPSCRAALLRFGGGAVATYGADASASVRVVDRKVLSPTSSRLTLHVGGELVTTETALAGVAGALACAAAVAVARAVVPLATSEELARAVALVPPNEAGRLSASELDRGIVLVDDAYNANPASMIAGIEAAAEIARARSARLVLVLGEMRELGERGDALHRMVGRAAAAHATGPVFLVGGPLVDALASEIGGAPQRFATDEGVFAALRQTIAGGDVVFLKASNSLRLHHVADEVRRAFAVPPQEIAS